MGGDSITDGLAGLFEGGISTHLREHDIAEAQDLSFKFEGKDGRLLNWGRDNFNCCMDKIS